MPISHYRQYIPQLEVLGRWATDSQGIWTPGGEPRTGTFHQMRVTAGDAACSVKGVLQSKLKH